MASKIRNITKFKSFGNSMLPILQNGDTLHIERAIFSQLKVNDIVVFKNRRKYITHRLIFKQKNFIIMKGDNNIYSDYRIAKERIIGRVFQITRNTQLLKLDTIYLVRSAEYFKEIILFTRETLKMCTPFVLLKGLLLNLLIQETPPQRIFADCDILVNSADFEKIDMIFKSLGYVPEDNTLYSLYQKGLKPDFKEIEYSKVVNNVRVVFDVHYKICFLTHKVKLPLKNLQLLEDRITQDFLDRKVTATASGLTFEMLSLDDLILYLFLHFYFHNWSQVYRLDFIANIIKRKKKHINWELIYDRAIEYKVENFIIPGFYLLAKYFKIKEPLLLAKKRSPKKYKYSLWIMKKVYNERHLFDHETMSNARIKRALLIFLLTDAPWLEKLSGFLTPAMMLHGVIFIPKVIYNNILYLIYTGKFKIFPTKLFKFKFGIK